MKNVIRGLLSILCSVLLVSPSFALGSAAIANDVPSARAGGQGYVGVAGQNDDPTAVFTNPAALTDLKGTQVTMGATWENLHGGYESNAGQQVHMRSIDVGVPNFAVTQSFLGGKIGSGLSVGSPYGLETHWSGDSPLRYTATNSVLHVVTVSPAVAYQVCPAFSAGFGGDYYNVFDASLERHIDVSAINGSPSPDGNSKLYGTGTNWGYHAGFVVKPNERNAIGVTYHSKVKLTITGTASATGLTGLAASPFVFGGANVQTAAYTDIFLPQNIQFGYSFKPNDRWTLEADTAWFDWYSSRDINIRYASPVFTALSANNNPTPSDWRDEWSFASGANYKATDRLQVRGGLWYEPPVAPESTFSPAYMDITRYGISSGVGFLITSSLTFDFSYNAIFFHNRVINNNVGALSAAPPNNTVNGKYSNFANLVAMNLTYRFNSQL